MPAAKYLVVVPPGVHVPPHGWISAGRTFDAPSPGYVPSATFRALNDEAATALGAAIDARIGVLQGRLELSVGIADITKVNAEISALQANRAESVRVLGGDELSALSSTLQASNPPFIPQRA